MEDWEKLLEPAESYSNFYKEEFFKNASELFQELLEKSNINKEENKAVAAQYRKSNNETATLKKKLSSAKAYRVLLIILIVASLLGVYFGISNSGIILITASLVVCIGSFLLIFLFLNKKIKSLNSCFEESDKKTKSLYDKAMALISPLLDLFESSMTAELIQKTVPTLKLDKNYNMKRFDYLHGKYGYPEDDGSEISTVGIMSGEIIGNPFVFEKKLSHAWGTQTYTGSLTIHWTTYEQVDGKTQARHHSQVLHASVQKPKPFFTYSCDLVYGNEAAPDLCFSRSKTHAESLSENKLKSFVKSRSKKIKKLAKEKMDEGFTELGNEEFDALFGAFNRDNEVQFRLLFTPLAQKNILSLIKGGSPYGDDFNIVKHKCINIVSTDHGQNRDFNIDVSTYYSYDADICRELFIKYNEEYFKSVYFDFAPLLSIPIYQQIKPQEYIYKDNYERNYTAREAEVIANTLGFSALSHPASVTPAILKTRFTDKENDIDKVCVHALSYRTVKKVDFVPVYGNDGRTHDVPVPWLKYIPLEQETRMELKELNISRREYRHSEYAADDHKHTFHHSIFATLGEIDFCEDGQPDENDQDISEYGEITEEEVNTISEEDIFEED